MEFPITKIVIRPLTDYWGPFAFNVSASLPAGDALTAQTTVTSFLNGVESTAHLIEAGSMSIDSATISLRFQYPGNDRVGSHELRFNLVLASGAKHTLIFGFVKVSG